MKLNLQKVLLLLPLFLCVSLSNFIKAQELDIDDNVTVANAIQDILLGAGVDAFNVTYNGSAANAQNTVGSVMGFTDSNNTGFPISEGVHITTEGAPNINDPDLDAIASNTVTNGVIIEFDFVADGNELNFNYIFASEEYESYTCSNYNDVFGFFLSGPGINGTFTNDAVNLAIVPGSNDVPVAINTVNSGSASGFNPSQNCADADPNWQSNAVYFTTDYNSIYEATFTEEIFGIPIGSAYNGSTIVLPANSPIQCNETYHIKMAISNVGDESFDSGVFLEAGSFASEAIEIEIGASNNIADSLIYRDCTEGLINFNRFSCDLDEALTIFVESSGTALPGDDYETFPDEIEFESGQSSTSLSIVPTPEGSGNDPVYVDVYVFFLNEDGDTISSEGRIWIQDPPPLETEASNIEVKCASDSVAYYVTPSGIIPFEYEWETGVTDSIGFAGVEDNGTYSYVVTVTDACGQTTIDTAYIELDQTLTVESMEQTPSGCGENTGSVIAVAGGETGTVNYQWSGPGTVNPSFENNDEWTGIAPGWYYITVTDDVCSAMDSILVEQEDPPIADFSADPSSGNIPLNVTFTNNSSGASSFDWDFDNMSTAINVDQSNQSTVYNEEGEYEVILIAYEGSCSDTAFLIITVTDISEVTYDMPNVFTPNGDGINDVFKINDENAVSLEMVIMNRWGNVVFESNSLNAAWNGRVNNDGADCSEGTYYYQFVIVGEDGVEINEHGAVQLVRDNQNQNQTQQ